jgi:hypothetical protein
VVTRADVAACCVEALTNKAAEGVTLELWSKPASLGFNLDTQLKTLFDGLNKDSAAKDS